MTYPVNSWKTSHSRDLRRRYLIMAIKFDLFYIFLLIYCFIHSGEEASRKENGKSTRRPYNKWKSEEEKELLFFDALTNSEKIDQFGKIKSYWRNAHPNSNLSDVALYSKLRRLRQESQEEGEGKRYFERNKKKERELLEIYFNTYPYKTNATIKLEEEWQRRYEDYPLSRNYLQKLVRQIFKEIEKNPNYLEEETPDTDAEWDNQHDSDLMHIHNVAQLERDPYWKDAQQMWYDLYPQFSHVSLDQLKKRVTHLENNPPNENFPWTEEENEELLDIFHKTMPDEENQGQRIYDIWSKIHPQYKFMTPYYLQIHASTLAYKRESEKASGSLRRKWTHGEKSDLVNLYHQHKREQVRHHGFHKEWVRKHPRLAYYTNKHLKTTARQLEDRGFKVDLERLEEETSSRKNRKYELEGERNFHKVYDRPAAEESRRSKRLTKGYNEEHEADTPKKFGSMKKLMGSLMREKSDKRAGKAPLVYSSDEQEPSTSRMSYSSE